MQGKVKCKTFSDKPFPDGVKVVSAEYHQIDGGIAFVVEHKDFDEEGIYSALDQVRGIEFEEVKDGDAKDV